MVQLPLRCRACAASLRAMERLARLALTRTAAAGGVGGDCVRALDPLAFFVTFYSQKPVDWLLRRICQLAALALLLGGAPSVPARVGVIIITGQTARICTHPQLLHLQSRLSSCCLLWHTADQGVQGTLPPIRLDAVGAASTRALLWSAARTAGIALPPSGYRRQCAT